MCYMIIAYKESTYCKSPEGKYTKVFPGAIVFMVGEGMMF